MKLNNKGLKIFCVAFCGIFGCASLVNFAAGANLKSTFNWLGERDNEAMIQALSKDFHNKKRSNPVSLGINWLFEPAINYYRESKHLTFLKPVDRYGYDKIEFDYFYIFKTDTFNTASVIKIDTVKEFESTILLCRNK